MISDRTQAHAASFSGRILCLLLRSNTQIRSSKCHLLRAILETHKSIFNCWYPPPSNLMQTTSPQAHDTISEKFSMLFMMYVQQNLPTWLDCSVLSKYLKNTLVIIFRIGFSQHHWFYPFLTS